MLLVMSRSSSTKNRCTMRILFFLLIFLCTLPAWAAETIPIKITANAMSYSQKNDQVVFTGDVYVLRQDIQLWCDALTVLLEQQPRATNSGQAFGDQQSSIKKIIATGNVRMKAEPDRSGTCGKATYDAQADLLTMEDNPIVMEGQNQIQGEIIKMYIEENRSEVIGGTKRVEAIFHSPAQKSGSVQ